MAGGFTIGGLISGLDTNSIISQLMAIERQPLQRLQARKVNFQSQQTGIRELRTTLLNLRNLIKDFQIGTKFAQFAAPSTNESILTASASSSNPVQGTYQVEVLQLANATVARSSSRLGAPINPNAALNSSGLSSTVTAGTFTVNGVQFTINPGTDTLTGILNNINASAAGVTATYDSISDTVRFENNGANNTAIINFGATGDTSDLLTVLGVRGAVQTTGVGGSTVVSSNRSLGAVSTSSVLNTVNFAGGAVTAGNFRINGVTITVDPTTDTLSNVLARINASDAGVTATFDASNDTIRVVSKTLGSRTINFQGGTSNFLSVTNLVSATQTAGQDAQYRVDGGTVQMSNTNDVTGAVTGVTVSLRGVGTASITVGPDDDAIIEEIQSFVDKFNASVTKLNDLTKKGGILENDGTLRSIESFLRANVFNPIAGLAGGIESLRDIGISSGAAFDQTAVFQLELDTEKLRTSILENRGSVESLFTNASETGIADSLFELLDGATSSTGFLNERARAGGSIDRQIEALNSRIDNLDRIIGMREARLRRQFLQLETITGSLQSQSQSLAGLANVGSTLR